MQKTTIIQLIGLLAIIVGITVMVGWFLDNTLLTSIYPGWIRMKFATAICFVCSGVITYFLSFLGSERREVRQVVLTIFPMLIILIMGTLFLGSVIGFQSGMENISFVDIHELKTPIFQGRPSVATMLAFLLIASTGFIYNFNIKKRGIMSIFGAIVGVIGFLGILGYLFQVPALYYEIPGISNAIALNTTILFTLLGVAIYLVGTGQNLMHENSK